jgi:hypothetical protein
VNWGLGEGPDGAYCKLCDRVGILHKTGCPLAKAPDMLGMQTMFTCLRCGRREDRPFYGLDEAQGLCQEGSGTMPTGTA